MTKFKKKVSYSILVYISLIFYVLFVELLVSKLYVKYLIIMVRETFNGGANVKLIDIEIYDKKIFYC